MDYFEWWPFEIFIMGQMALGLALLLAFSFLKGPAKQLSTAMHEAELQLQKLRAFALENAKPAGTTDQAAA